MAEKTALDYALDLFTVPLSCECGRIWSIKSKRVRPLLQTVCPKCRKVDHIDEPTAIRINTELNDAMKQVARQLGVPPVRVEMPKFRAPRALSRPDPRGYPVNLIGESFYQETIRKCGVGDRVTLLREPRNEHDPKAIVAVDKGWRTLGYIPRDNFLHRLIHEEGGGCSASILSLHRDQGGSGNIGVVLDVIIDDTSIGAR